MSKKRCQVNKKNRTSYNLIRVIAMLMVLGVHVSNEVEQFMESYNTTWYLNSIFTCVTMLANPLFFMLSGKFNLGKEFHNIGDYIFYYYKKAITIVCPLILCSIVVYFIKFDSVDWNLILFMKRLFNNEIESVYWFVYALGSILVFSPFFSKMIGNMSQLDKTVFFVLLIGVNALITGYLCVGYNQHMNYNSFGIISWHLFYIIGYLLEDVVKTRKAENVFILFGGVGLMLQFLMDRFAEGLAVPLYDPTPWMIFEAIAAYFIILRIAPKNKGFSKVIDKLAEISFIFYLLHMLIMKKVVSFFPLNISASVNALCFIGIFVISFVIIVLVSMIIHRCILKPFTKFMCDIYLKKHVGDSKYK